MEEESKHGIAIRDKKTKELVDFIECGLGNSALRVLSGVRHNLDSRNYYATEDFVKSSEYSKLKGVL